MAISRKDLNAIFIKDFETSVEQSNYSLKKRCDLLAGYLNITMQALVDNGQEDFVLLKHDGLRQWWIDNLATIRKKEAEHEAKLRRAEIKIRALSKLTEEEKAALGIKKK